MKHPKRIIIAFSGGLDTSAIIPWLKENYDSPEIIAYCSDLGNAPDETYLRKWSAELGASEFIFEDLKDCFAENFAFKAVRAGATYQDDYLLGTALGRPLIAERMAHFAKKLGATAMVHGATGKGNDQLRFEKSWAYLAPELQVIAPWKIWAYKGRQDLQKYLSSKGFKIEVHEKLFSVDVNLFHRSCEGGILENPSLSYDPEKIYEWVKAPSLQNQESYTLTVEFEKGMPLAVNHKKMGAASLLGFLNEVAGKAGVGAVDLVEERANGIKSRGVYETPGGTLLHLALRSLKHLCWDHDLMSLGRKLGLEYGELLYGGNWHTDSRRAIEGFFDMACETLSGEVELKLQAGQARVTKRESANALYDEGTVSFESDEHGILKNAEGYSKTLCFKHWISGKRDVKMGRKLL